MNNDGVRKDGIGKRWRENWSKCFDRQISSESEVCAGDKGSIGIGFWIPTNLDVLLFLAKTDKEKQKILMDTHPIIGAAGSGGNCTDPSMMNKPVSKESLNMVVKFYNFAESNDIYFAIKRGTKGLWLAKKTSKYFHAPPENRAGGVPLSSEYQKTPEYFEHRFRFEIIRPLSAEEVDLPGCRTTIRYKTITVPA